jgi:2-dehydropantoate 2-reductase
MRIGIIGAGAVGGYFGFRLAKAGCAPTFLVRGATLAALRGRGLQVTIGGVRDEAAVDASGDPGALASCEAILVAVKNLDLAQALAAARVGMGEGAFAVTLQNGVQAPGEAARALGPGRVVAGVAYLGAERIGPGEIVHTGLGKITVGELEAPSSRRCSDLVALLEAVGIPARQSGHVVADLWRKLVWNAAFNGPTALARCAPAALVADPAGRELCRRLAEEVREAARLRGIDLPASSAEETLRMSESLTQLRTSMLQDLEAGRPLEVEALYGHVLGILRGAGRPAPAHEAVAALLSAAARCPGSPSAARPSPP